MELLCEGDGNNKEFLFFKQSVECFIKKLFNCFINFKINIENNSFKKILFFCFIFLSAILITIM